MPTPDETTPTDHEAADQAAADHAAPAAASTSVARLMAAIESINAIEVINSPVDDQSALLQLLDVTTDDQRSNMLFALLLERMRAKP
ncbi:hypothetical protein [Cryobacterium sp. PAMC25264]|uniref:hypothetical protein n=1 Tax=Cryobacterium sp. PAMC25264 TaxID=2861288 RepID=UPI001C6331F1|nr:hypothetical protein [Cryobacterium sp. PAMC25264]QYF72272.1 hypothetical protein KY500_10430 [Cryobacterium sp. PAMC25264]